MVCCDASPASPAARCRARYAVREPKMIRCQRDFRRLAVGASAVYEPRCALFASGVPAVGTPRHAAPSAPADAPSRAMPASRALPQVHAAARAATASLPPLRVPYAKIYTRRCAHAMHAAANVRCARKRRQMRVRCVRMSQPPQPR